MKIPSRYLRNRRFSHIKVFSPAAILYQRNARFARINPRLIGLIAFTSRSTHICKNSSFYSMSHVSYSNVQWFKQLFRHLIIIANLFEKRPTKNRSNRSKFIFCTLAIYTEIRCSTSVFLCAVRKTMEKSNSHFCANPQGFYIGQTEQNGSVMTRLMLAS